jgi:hypothetical protein
MAVLRLRRDGNLPPIPAKCGALMQTLIAQCWKTNPRDRPSFEDVLALFQRDNFAVVPDADAAAISGFCRYVQAWEAGIASGVAE